MHETMTRLYLAARELRDAHNQAALAVLLNQSPQTINNWETRGISQRGMLEAERIIGCSAIWLKTGTGSMRTVPVAVDAVSEQRVTSTPDRSAERVPDGYVRLRMLDATPYMGAGGSPVDFPEVVHYVDILRDYLITELRCNPENIDLLPTRGDSMKGTIEHGDIAFVDRTVRHFDGDGIYVIVWGEGLMIKRLQALPWGGMKIKSDNPNYDSIEVHGDDANRITICGRVTGKWAVSRI